MRRFALFLYFCNKLMSMMCIETIRFGLPRLSFKFQHRNHVTDPRSRCWRLRWKRSFKCARWHCLINVLYISWLTDNNLLQFHKLHMILLYGCHLTKFLLKNNSGNYNLFCAKIWEIIIRCDCWQIILDWHWRKIILCQDSTDPHMFLA